MKGILSKILVFSFILVSTFYLLSSATLANATSQTPPTQSTQYVPPNTNPDVPNNLHNWTQNVMIEVMSALSCQITGIDPTNPNQQCLGVDQKTGKIGFVPSAGTGQAGGGAIGVMNKLITMTFTIPIHSGDYVRYLSQNFGIVKPAYAQGTGFNSLSPFLDIWVVFRNLVYLLFIIVFVVIGMFIMLRVQFDPRTVMTVQNQIPKLIIGIVLVTFSFAIAGLLIDAMYIAIYMVYGLALTIPGTDPTTFVNLSPTVLQGATPMDAVGGLGGIAGVAKTVSIMVVGVLGNIVLGTNINWGLISTLFIAAPVTFGLSGAAVVVGGAVGLVVGIITFLIISIAILFALFRLWFELIKS